MIVIFIRLIFLLYLKCFSVTYHLDRVLTCSSVIFVARSCIARKIFIHREAQASL